MIKQKRKPAIVVMLVVLICILGLTGCAGNSLLGYLLERRYTAEKQRGGATMVFEAQKENPTEDEMKIVESLMRTRLDGLGYVEGTVTRQGRDKVRVEIPSLTDTAAAVEALGAAAQLQFLDAEGNEIMSGAYIKDARAEFSPVEPGGKNEYHLVLEFTGEGQQKFAEATAKAAAAAAPNNIIAITMDGKILSAPSVKETINSDSCIVHGGFENDDEVISLANNIRSGQLPFELECIESSISEE